MTTPAEQNPAPRWLPSLTATARHISEKFGIRCTKQQICTIWKKKTPAFPAPDAAGRYNIELVEEWVKNHIPTMGPADGQMAELLRKQTEAKAKLTIRKDRRDKLNFEIEKGKYVLKAEAESSIISFARRYHAFVRAEFERNMPLERREDLAQLGASPEIIAAFYERDCKRAVESITRIEALCEQAGKEK